MANRTHGYAKPGPDTIFALDLVISDENKPLLLSNLAFVPYLCVATCRQRVPALAHRMR
jgi:hypothetical protein